MVENAKLVPLIGRSSPPLLRRMRPVPERPVTVPPTANELVPQLTTTVVTLPATTLPASPLTTQVCAGTPVGCVLTVTLNGAPLATGVRNVKLPFELMERSSPKLFCNSTDLPLAKPPTLPPTVKVVV